MRQLRIKDRQPDAKERKLLEQEPGVDAAMRRCIDCWFDLDSCRPIGPISTGPIPFTAVLEWARLHRLDREWTITLADVIRYLDAQRSDRLASEFTTERNKQKAKARR